MSAFRTRSVDRSRIVGRGLDRLQHLVVVMMENRSFDHMLGGLSAQIKDLDGVPAGWSNPDPNGHPVPARAAAQYQGQLDPDPDHHFPAVDKQIFGGSLAADRRPTMDGFVKSYFDQQHDVDHAARIMYFFSPAQLPILTALASNYLVFNRWFASIPGPTICNRAFAHYGTSFGSVSMDMIEIGKGASVYERLLAAGRETKLYYFDETSSTMEIANLLKNQPQLFGTYQDFLSDCRKGQLPAYSFVEPNYTDHPGPTGQMIASDQHPDHHVLQGERFIGSIFNAIRNNSALWATTAMLVVYDEHGGIFDHVEPPACTPDGHVADADATGTGREFRFDRLGVRVPAILISPWVPKGVSNEVFEHASIPATVTSWLLPTYDQTRQDRTPREKAANTFLDFLSLDTMRTDV